MGPVLSLFVAAGQRVAPFGRAFSRACATPHSGRVLAESPHFLAARSQDTAFDRVSCGIAPISRKPASEHCIRWSFWRLRMSRNPERAQSGVGVVRHLARLACSVMAAYRVGLLFLSEASSSRPLLRSVLRNSALSAITRFTRPPHGKTLERSRARNPRYTQHRGHTVEHVQDCSLASMTFLDELSHPRAHTSAAGG